MVVCDKPPFDPSIMVHFRKRLSPVILAEINEVIVNGALEKNGKYDNTRGQGNTNDTQPPEEPNNNNSGIIMKPSKTSETAIRLILLLSPSEL